MSNGTPLPNGEVLRSIDLGAQKVQTVKLDFGTGATETLVDPTHPLPVAIVSGGGGGGGSTDGLTDTQLRANPVSVSGTVAVSNLPTTQPVSGTIAVSNFPATQPVSGTVAVTGTFWPATQPVSGTVAVSNFPATQPISGTVAVSNFPATQPVSGTVAVTGTFWQATQPISGTVTVTGVATEATLGTASSTLTTMLARTPALGSTTAAQSSPVVIASDQAAIPISQPLVSATGTITTQNLVPAGTATAGSAVELTLNGANALTIQTTGTYTGALSLQVTLDGTTWVTMGGVPLLNVNTGGYLATVTSALQSVFQADVGGMLKARVTGLAAMTGTATVTMKASPGAASMLALDASLPAGSNAIGTVTLSANTPTLAAGTNNVGGVVDRAIATTNGYTRTRFTAAAGLNGTVLKASAGNAIRFRLKNKSANEVFLKWHNSTTVTPGTTAVAFVQSIAAGANANEDFVIGQEFFSTGICVSFSTVNSDTDTTGVLAAGDVFGFFTVV